MARIVKAKIICPENIYAPLLLTKVNGITMAPTGTWTDWYCTVELKNAIKYGYQVEVLEGYHWSNSEHIFEKYVDTLYNLRSTFDKKDPRNLICKLLLNSLYGRFGLNPSLLEHSFVEQLDREDKLIDIKKLKTNNIYSYTNNKNVDSSSMSLDISLPIAIFTAAYARIYMSKFLIDYSDHLYYSDTDSIFLDCPLPDSVVGTGLGLFKLEYKSLESVFISPKVYSSLLPDGSEVTKVKGSNKTISFKDLYTVWYNNNSLAIPQDRWVKNYGKGNISINQILYHLSVTENKRIFIKNEQGVNINTKSININD